MYSFKYIIGRDINDNLIYVTWSAKGNFSHKEVCKYLFMSLVVSAGFGGFTEGEGFWITGKSETLDKDTTDEGKELLKEINSNILDGKILLKECYLRHMEGDELALVYMDGKSFIPDMKEAIDANLIEDKLNIIRTHNIYA